MTTPTESIACICALDSHKWIKTNVQSSKSASISYLFVFSSLLHKVEHQHQVDPTCDSSCQRATITIV